MRRSGSGSDAELDEFVARSRARNGECYAERRSWNEEAGADAVRHFALGTADPNPLWIDPAHAAADGRRPAPPAFLLSVRYPVLHGASPWPNLANLIAELEFAWEAPLEVGDRFRAETRQVDVRDGRRGDGGRFACILSEATYWNQRDEVVARTAAKLLWLAPGGAPLVDRAPHRYSAAEVEATLRELRDEERRGARPFAAGEVAVGRELPPLLRPPLTISDLVNWQAAAGPSQGAGYEAVRHAAESLAAQVDHPLTGWPVHPSAHHEDPHLAPMRGVSLPFDNGAMRFAWIAPLLTNWMGDHGVLERLRIQLRRPILYGDQARYAARIERCTALAGGVRVELRLRGTNQLGETTTTGSARILLPPRCFERPAAVTGYEPPPRSPGRPASVVDLFAARVQRHPEAVAVDAADGSASYAELEAASNRLAHLLRDSGARAGACVALFLRRRPLALATALAVAKCGAIRVSLDPEYASGDRLGSLLRAVDATLLLCDADREPPPSASLPAATRVLALAPGSADGAPDSALGERVDGAAIAYVVFTSGSTGAPKPVAVPHASLVRAQLDVDALLHLQAGDRCLHAASFAFSAAERQLWLPLSTGASLVLAGEGDRRDPRRLLETMQERAVTVWDTVPSWLRLCLDRLEELPEELGAALPLDRLRLLLATGEPLPWSLVSRWLRRHRQVRVVNLYSQTETAGTVCARLVDAAPADASGSVPIGHPLGGVRVHLLDETLAPVPDGEAGEICVAGERLAAGYLGEDGLDSERFVPDPFARDGGRLYRSGDLGRRNRDGELEFVGRVDDRIEVRGVRVEPAEVEAALCAHPGVREAFVRADEAGMRLVAYLVAGAAAAPPPVELGALLRRRLPPYMVPSAYVWLDALPRTASGKVARDALPPPGAGGSVRSGGAPPTDALEREIAAAWADVLGLRSIGVDDDFFALGGDSVLAVSAVVEAERRLDRPLSLDWLYDSSTVRAFAARARLPEVPRSAPSLVPLSPGPAARSLFCIAGGGGHVFAFRPLAALLSDTAVWGLQLPGLDDAQAPLARIEDIAAEFLRQMRVVLPHAPAGLLGYSFGGLVAYELARQLAAAGDEVGFLGLLDTPGPGAFRPRPLAERVGVHVSRLRPLAGGDRLRYLGGVIARRVRRWTGLPAAAAKPYAGGSGTPTERRMRAVYEAHVRAARSYRPLPYSGRLWLYRAEPEEWMRLAVVEPTYGWGALCGDVRVRPLPGTHDTALSEANAAALAAAVGEALAEVERARACGLA